MAGLDLTAEITAALKEYTGAVMDGIDKAVETCGKGMRKEIAGASPSLSGDYGKGWRCKISDHGRGNKSARVHNKTDYQLTHLLEKGHKKRGGKGSVKAYVHIAPAAKKWTKKFEQLCEEECEWA